MSSLTQKNCLVTGGTRGIGRAIAKMLAQQGANVVICGRSPESTALAAAELTAESGNKVKGKAADVSNHTQVVELFAFLGLELGPLDVLVNNAGIGVFGDVGELSIDQWKAVIETNLYGAFYCVGQAIAGFETKGGGHIVNIGSIAGSHAFAGGAAYNASKFALAGFSEAVMQDLRTKKIRVSQVAPGSVATEFSREHNVATEFSRERSVDTGFGSGVSGADWKIWPEDVAEVVRMLLMMPERTLVSRIELRPSVPKS